MTVVAFVRTVMTAPAGMPVAEIDLPTSAAVKTAVALVTVVEPEVVTPSVTFLLAVVVTSPRMPMSDQPIVSANTGPPISNVVFASPATSP